MGVDYVYKSRQEEEWGGQSYFSSAQLKGS